MAIDLDPLAVYLADLIDDLPTEATYRGQVINVRIGEAPKTREMLWAGMQPGQVMEALIKAEDVTSDPTNGESMTINTAGYKITSVTPLLALSEPIGYRVTLSKLV